MKSKLFITSILLFAVASCGNPHISSTKNDLDKTTPPLLYEEGADCSLSYHTDFKFYYLANGPFSSGPNCRRQIQEDFNSYPSGTLMAATNRGRESHSYEIFHRIERTYDSEKVTYLDEIFGADHPFAIEKIVTVGKASGLDQGANSGVTESGKDTLIWNFSKPVSFFSVNVVGLRSSHSAPAKVRLFDCDKALQKELNIIYPSGGTGSDTIQFLGFSSGEIEVCHVSITAGLTTDPVAADKFTYSAR